MGEEGLLDGHNLFAIAVGMGKGAELDIAFYDLSREIHNSFVEVVLRGKVSGVLAREA